MGKIDNLIDKLISIELNLEYKVLKLDKVKRSKVEMSFLRNWRCLNLSLLNFLEKVNPITKDNFYISSKVVFKEVEKTPNRKPDYISYSSFVVWDNGDIYIDVRRYDDDEDEYAVLDDDFENPCKILDTFVGRYGDTGYKLEDDDEVSSKYWYTKKGVYRQSDHWGKVAQCQWDLENQKKGETQVGFAKWKNFKLND